MTTPTTQPEQEAIFTVCLMAAFADGDKSDLERAEVKRVAESFPAADLNTRALYQRVLLRQITLANAVAPLATTESRQLAYEMAVCVCEADDTLNDPEKSFLAELRQQLDLQNQTTAAFHQQADALAVAPLAEPAAAPASPPPVPTGNVTDAEVDSMVLNYSILNGALELLPESLATMAIVPLQLRMVYRIGKCHGYDLDRGHITELLGAAGVGLTSQVVEGFARKLIGGLLGKVSGGLGRGVGNQLASSAMSFASTYALGQVAQRYYAGGRQLSALQLKELFTSLVEKARSLHGRYAGMIQQRAAQVKPSQLLGLIRGEQPGEQMGGPTA
jgi:uncharacterized protein (DUF697 family)